ncbi:Ribosomal large subunit pseudouridine synthase A [Symbiodinium microadriaticum]|uniref:Ribosomal large subunit pseudouridine synthase A n=1 Tax=Symbiodinium microadriaticum TaxID=2951 RepID=A0A1Q9E7Y5_SYMMI|nr:Ribosomal large subunit pseudouridine synthase A [Symbiodinium microadriaticum]
MALPRDTELLRGLVQELKLSGGSAPAGDRRLLKFIAGHPQVSPKRNYNGDYRHTIFLQPDASCSVPCSTPPEAQGGPAAGRELSTAWQCSTCPRAFATRNQLFAHLAAEHGVVRTSCREVPAAAEGRTRAVAEAKDSAWGGTGVKLVCSRREPVRLDWVATVPRTRAALTRWLRAEIAEGASLPAHAPRSESWWKVAIPELLRFLQERSEIFVVGRPGGDEAEPGECRLRRTQIALTDAAWDDAEQLELQSQESLISRVAVVLKALQADPQKKCFSSQLLCEVAQDSVVQRLLHGRLLARVLAEDARFELEEDAKRGTTIRFSASGKPKGGPAGEPAAPPKIGHGQAPSGQKVSVEVLAVMERYAAVLDKPAGISTEDLIEAYQAEIHARAGEQSYRIQSVSRLDLPTSGALVVPLCKEAEEALKSRFSSREVAKTYLALAVGDVVPDRGAIDAKLRSVQTADRHRAVVHPYGKPAITLYRKLARLEGDVHNICYSLILAWPLTGRMHQIRAHFAHKGFPLAGDVRYAPKKDATAWCGRRLFLHAAHISLFDGFSAFSPPKDDLLKPLEEDADDFEFSDSDSDTDVEALLEKGGLKELKLPEDRLEQLADPGVYQRCRSPELGVDEMEREDTDVEALLEKGGLKDWDPSSTAPILAAPPRPPQPETPPEAFAEEAAAERREGYMPAPRLPARKPEPRAPDLALVSKGTVMGDTFPDQNIDF